MNYHYQLYLDIKKANQPDIIFDKKNNKYINITNEINKNKKNFKKVLKELCALFSYTNRNRVGNINVLIQKESENKY